MLLRLSIHGRGAKLAVLSMLWIDCAESSYASNASAGAFILAALIARASAIAWSAPPALSKSADATTTLDLRRSRYPFGYSRNDISFINNEIFPSNR
jgi:hypothetical protein